MTNQGSIILKYLMSVLSSGQNFVVFLTSDMKKWSKDNDKVPISHVYFAIFCVVFVFFPYNNIYKLLEGLFKDKLHEECFQVFSHHHGEGLFTILYKTHKAIIIQIMR